MNLGLKNKNILWVIFYYDVAENDILNNHTTIWGQLVDKNLIFGDNCNCYFLHPEIIFNQETLKLQIEQYVKEYSITTIFFHNIVKELNVFDNSLYFYDFVVPYEYFSDKLFDNIEVIVVVDDTYKGFYKYMDMDYVDLWVSIEVYTSPPYNDKHLCLFTPIPQLNYNTIRDQFCFFSGMLTSRRRQYLSQLLANNISVEINFNVGDFSRTQNFEKISNSKIGLNIPGNVMDYHDKYKGADFHHVKSYSPGRIMETLGCGTLLFYYIDEHSLINNFLEDGKHYVSFRNLEELIHKIKYYEKNEDLREKLAKEGYNYSKIFRIDNFYKLIFGRLGYYG